MFIRLMLLIPLLRGFMMCEELDEFDYVSPGYTDIDKIGALHAQAILHMNALDWKDDSGWPYSTHRIRTSARITKRGLFRRKHVEPVYEDVAGIPLPPRFFFMRGGAIYLMKEDWRGQGDPLTPIRQLDLARLDERTRFQLVRAFAHVLTIEPATVRR